jgi:hypothetical protein
MLLTAAVKGVETLIPLAATGIADRSGDGYGRRVGIGPLVTEHLTA